MSNSKQKLHQALQDETLQQRFIHERSKKYAYGII